MNFRPMLGIEVAIKDIHYPVIASPKLDGVRALGVGNELLSRTLKRIPNEALQVALSGSFEAWDGELIAGDPTAPDVYRRTLSQVMTRDAPSAGLKWYVFDNFLNPSLSFVERWRSLPEYACGPHIIRLEQQAIFDDVQLLAYEELVAGRGYEGLILRNPDGLYKHGRSTVQEGLLLKLKRFVDDEAPVIMFEEQMHNANLATKDERGYTKRSSHQSGKVPAGTLGAIVVRWRDRELRIGTGFTADERRTIWENQGQYYGVLAKFKYLPTGMKDLPRHPVWLGWRHRDDK